MSARYTSVIEVKRSRKRKPLIASSRSLSSNCDFVRARWLLAMTLLQRHYANRGRAENDDEQDRQEKHDHRHRELRRQAGGLLLGFGHAHVAIFLRQNPQRGSQRRAVTLGLLQGKTHRFHSFQ